MHPHLSAKAWRAGRHRGNVQNAEASVAHLSTPGPSKGQAATPPAPCFAIGLLTARTGKGLAAPFAGPPPGKSGRGPNPHSSMDKCCRHVLEPPETGGNLEQYSLSAISVLAERAVAALVPRCVP